MQINEVAAQIEGRLRTLERFTDTPGQGVTRLPFTKQTRAAADYLKAEMAQDGLEVWEDEAGNVFGRLHGRDRSLPCVMCGSHYDSVVHGGPFDGIAGVVCAMSLAKLLQRQGTPERDFVVAAFMDEEGCRCGGGCFGSKAMMGRLGPDYCGQTKDQGGVSVETMMEQYGLNPACIGQAAWPEGSIDRYLEIHVEQGPVLDARGIELGLVNCIVGVQRYMVTINGQSNHAGTTPMEMRLDAMERSARVIARVGEIARETGEGSVATVGYIEASPGAFNVIVSKVRFSVELRATRQKLVEQMASQVRQALDRETAGGLHYEMTQESALEPVHLSPTLLDKSQDICQRAGYSYLVMPSGAGHDAEIISRGVESAMLFVPSRKGLSHCPQEQSDCTDLARAVLVGLELVTAEQVCVGMKQSTKKDGGRKPVYLDQNYIILLLWCVLLVFMLFGSFGAFDRRPSGFLYAAAALGIFNSVRQIVARRRKQKNRSQKRKVARWGILACFVVLSLCFLRVRYTHSTQKIPLGNVDHIATISILTRDTEEEEEKERSLSGEEIPPELELALLECIGQYSMTVAPSSVPQAKIISDPYQFISIWVINKEAPSMRINLSSNQHHCSVQVGDKHFGIVDSETMREEIQAVLFPKYG